MDSRLLNACLTGDLPTVQRLVTSVHAENVDLNTKRGVLHMSPIHYACSGGHVDVAQYLIDKAGCDPLSRTQQGKTPLHLACETGHLKMVRFLLQTYHCDPACRDQKGQTPLHLASRADIAQYLVETSGCEPALCVDNVGRNPLHTAVSMNHAETVGYLLAERLCDPNASDNAGDVPLSLTDKPNMIGKLLSHGANPDFLQKGFKKYLPTLSSTTSPPVKLFVVGGTLAGNTSLTRALKKETLAKSEPLISSSGVKVIQRWDPPTAGVTHHAFANKQFGRVALYDFAGHTHYHTVQAALLNNSVCTTPPIFIVVTDLSRGKEAIEADIYYWLGFLANALHLPSNEVAQVILVGSHGDQVKVQGVDLSEWLDLESLRRTHPSRTVLNVTDFVPVDCRKASSPGLDLLCQTLKGACERVRGRFNPRHSYYTHCFWLWLSDTYEDATAVSLGALKARLRVDKARAREKMELFELMKGHHSSEEKRSTYLVSILPESEADLCDLCVELSDQAHVLFYYDLANVGNSWIVFHQGDFLEDVIGAVFAPPGYREHRYLATPTGIVTTEQLTQEFVAYPTEMLVHVLTGMECCLETAHTADDDPFASDPPFRKDCIPNPRRDGRGGGGALFFPCLVTIEDPGTAWDMHGNQLTCYVGWTLVCSDVRQPFALQFFHILVLRIVLTFNYDDAPSSPGKPLPLKKVCSVWKDGVFLMDPRGVKCLVEMSSDRTQLVVRVASRPDATVHMAKVFSLLLQLVLRAKDDHSSLTPTGEFLLHPSDVKGYPLGPSPSLFPIKDVAKAIIGVDEVSFSHEGAPVMVRDLFPFEPYLGLGLVTIGCIFDHPSSCLSVSADVSSKIAGYLPLDGACLTSYENLRAKLNQFSVFAGRNPLVVSGIQEVWPSSPPPSLTTQPQPFS